MSFLWGNTSNQQPDPKKFANISDDQINSNQQAVPVKYLAGRNYLAGDFISPAYNPKAVPVKSQSGKGQSTTTGYKYFADFALVFCTGGRRPVDAVYKVIVDSDIRWPTDGSGGIVRGNQAYEVITVQDLGTIHLYWGSESQGIDKVLLNVRPAPIAGGNKQDSTTWAANHQSGAAQFGGIDAGDINPYSGHYDQHPAYRGQCYGVFKDWKLGRDRTSVPNIQLELARGCPAPWLAGGGTPMPPDDRGVNPIAVLYDWLTDTRFGMALPDSFLNLTNAFGGFQYAYNALEAVQARISPMISQQNNFRQVIAELMEYFDGWIRRNGTKIEAGMWKTGSIAPGPTLLDDDLLHEPELDPQGWGPTMNETTVVYKDRQHHFNDYTQVYRDANNFRVTGGPRPTTLSRPYLTDANLAKQYARTIGAASALPFTQGDLTVKREWLTSNAMQPGMVFTYKSGFYGLSFLMRLLEVEHEADKSAEAKMTVQWERSKWPSLYVPPGFQGPGGFVLGPRGIWSSRITEVPYLLVDHRFDTQVICLAVRGNVESQGFRVWVSFDNVTYTILPNNASSSSFAYFGRLNAAIGNTITQMQVTLYGIGNEEVVSQHTQQMQDDTLLAFIDGEVTSLGGVIPQAGGISTINMLRGRLGTAAATHSAATLVYFIYRADLRYLDNSGFIPGTQVWFKLQPFTADLDYDITIVTPITYTIVGFPDLAGPVPNPGAGTFTSSVWVSITNRPPNCVLRYTTDGTPVSGTSPTWTGSKNFAVTTTIRLRFYHLTNGTRSQETIATYTKVPSVPGQGPPLPACATPSWTYSGVLNHSGGNLVLTASTPGSIIHYSKNGATWVTGGGPLTVALASGTSGDVIEFYASKSGMNDSPHHTIDNSREITFGGGGHFPPRNPP